MTKIFKITTGIVLTSCYFFPFVLEAFPVANSKMILAAVGLFLFGMKMIQDREARISKNFLSISIWAIAVSLIASFSMTFNETTDNTFSSYLISMWVWLSGAYTIVSYIRYVHGKINAPLIVHYLLSVCALQCILALAFDIFPQAELWHAHTFTGEAYMGNTDKDRLHGIGCSLDVAGFRFSAVLVMTAYVIYHMQKKGNTQHTLKYLTAMLFISIEGNMIARSTTIGLAVSVLFLGWVIFTQKGGQSILIKLSLVTITTIVVVAILYSSSKDFNQNFRFGFEGFFSYAETGEWHTHSNDILKNMVVWPDNLKTWIIGDGYINNPLDKSLPTYDPYYVGKAYGGYYKGTDIGYLRYIFYFGVIGLITFSLFFVKVCQVCIQYSKAFKWMFILVLAINFIQWLKVSTDLFVVFAPFLCLGLWENETAEQESLEHLETAEQ